VEVQYTIAMKETLQKVIDESILSLVLGIVSVISSVRCYISTLDSQVRPEERIECSKLYP